MSRLFLYLVLGFALNTHAQVVEVNDKGETKGVVKTGAERAREYFKVRKAEGRKPAAEGEEESAPAALSGNPRYLMLHIGTFFDDQAYKWGRGDDQSDLGELNVGVTYRLGEWINSADFLARMDLTTYGLKEGNARKISISGLVTFPDANSRFPLYFGGGIGAGIFFKQIKNESALALDYSLIAGARFFNVIDQLGFMFEFGLKNHLHLLSDGQFNGVFVNVGTVFSF